MTTAHITIPSHVTVAVPYGPDDVRLFTGMVEARMYEEDTDRFMYRIRFDDPLIYGGTGVAWVTEDQFR
jgi:hypothetical protein